MIFSTEELPMAASGLHSSLTGSPSGHVRYSSREVFGSLGFFHLTVGAPNLSCSLSHSGRGSLVPDGRLCFFRQALSPVSPIHRHIPLLDDLRSRLLIYHPYITRCPPLPPASSANDDDVRVQVWHDSILHCRILHCRAPRHAKPFAFWIHNILFHPDLFGWTGV